ncbi:MAG: hypothetical protein ACRENE_13370 [Polyangiaceae bacterium]
MTFNPAVLLPAVLLLALACNQSPGGSADCSNGTCACPQGAHCTFSCASPPCHVACGTGSSCSGVCANGDCSCQTGATCSFTCGAPPCHVTCDGNNPHCDGTCADGTCACAAGSSCHFQCASGPCHTLCPAGASCVVTCPNTGVAGTADCDIVSCGTGAATVCPDGLAVACNAPCPTD